jgi:DNA mismatch repair protein MSH3
MNGIKRSLEETHLQAMRRDMSMPSLTFVSVSGNEYIVEVPVAAKSRVPSGWKLVMSTSKVARYRSAAVVSAFEELQVQKHCGRSG